MFHDFGSFFRECRLKRGLTLRTAAIKLGWDSGNLSRMERGLVSPLSSGQRISEVSKTLGFSKAAINVLKDLAYQYYVLRLREKFK